jgi:hypothetical protein
MQRVESGSDVPAEGVLRETSEAAKRGPVDEQPAEPTKKKSKKPTITAEAKSELKNLFDGDVAQWSTEFDSHDRSLQGIMETYGLNLSQVKRQLGAWKLAMENDIRSRLATVALTDAQQRALGDMYYDMLLEFDFEDGDGSAKLPDPFGIIPMEAK